MKDSASGNEYSGATLTYDHAALSLQVIIPEDNTIELFDLDFSIDLFAGTTPTEYSVDIVFIPEEEVVDPDPEPEIYPILEIPVVEYSEDENGVVLTPQVLIA